MSADAPDRAPLDPPHEFEDVALQIGGNPPMSGFAQQPYWNVSRQAFAAGALPVLRTLASQYFLFDNWYSSMPGPTWPNRFFLHAGSSGGLDNSPAAATTIESETIDSLSFSFPNGTLFTCLQQAKRSWRVYHDDLFPQALAIKDMIDPFRLNTGQFSGRGPAKNSSSSTIWPTASMSITPSSNPTMGCNERIRGRKLPASDRLHGGGRSLHTIRLRSDKQFSGLAAKPADRYL